MPSLELTYLKHQPQVFDCPARNVVYAKGRRAGGTRGAATRLIELALEKPGSRHLWVDTVRRNIERYIRRYFRPLLRQVEHRWNGTTQVLEFANGSYCDFASAERPESMEGFAYDYVWVNEAGLILKNEDIYFHTLLPMVLESAHAQLFFIGAPKGRGLFQRMFQWGEDPSQSDWRSFRHPSQVNSRLDRRELQRFKEHMPEHVYRQEILAEFVAADGAVFRNVDTVANAVEETAPAPGAAYVLGVDLARYGDFTVAWVGRPELRAAVYCDRFSRLPWKAQVERIGALARRFGAGALYVDATGVGDPICEDLAEAGLPVHPVVLSAPRKRMLIDHLAVGIEQERLHFAPHAQTLRELNAYTRMETREGHTRLSAPSGDHDDCVIALALCYWGMTAGVGEFILGPTLVTSEPDW